MSGKKRTREELEEELVSLRRQLERLENERDDSRRMADALLRTQFEVAMLVNPDSSIVDLNEAAARNLGKPASELVGKIGWDYLPPEIAAKRKEYWREVLQKKIPVRWADEREGRFFESVIHPILDAEGNIFRCVVFSREITERRVAEVTLQRREALFLAVNFAAQRFMRTPAWENEIESVLDRIRAAADLDCVFLFEMFHGEDERLLTRIRHENVAPGIPTQIDNPEFRNVDMNADGFGRWVELLKRGESIHGVVRNLPGIERSVFESYGIRSVAAVPIFSGHTWWGYFGCHDFNEERVWPEAELEALRAVAGAMGAAIQRDETEIALRESEVKYRNLVEQSTQGIMVNQDFRIVFANAAMAEICGREIEELLSFSAEEVKDLIHPEDQERMWRSFWDRLSGAVILPSYEFRIVRPDGSIRWLVLTVTRIDFEGNPAIQSVAVDVTEQKQLEQRLIHAHKLEAIGQLAGGIAHDFNNLITGIMGCTQFMVKRMKDGDPLKKDAEEIGHGAERAAALTRQLLAFASRQNLEPVLLDLHDVIEGLEHLIRRSIGARVRIDIRQAEEDVHVMADRGQLEQVLMNLVINAHDVLPRGGELTIRTEVVSYAAAECEHLPETAPGRYGCFSVTDNGPGMDPDVMSHIFDPFFTTKTRSKGTGLGLSVAFGIVRQHGGFIEVTSRPGEGAVFRICLPLVETATAEEQLAMAGQGAVPGEQGAAQEPVEFFAVNGECALVVEDREEARRFTARALSEYGFDVVEAESAEAALEMITEQGLEVQLMVIDIELPGISGIDLVIRLRDLGQQTGAILVSGYSDKQVELQALDEENNLFLPKPFTPEALLDQAARLLGSK